MISLLPKRVKSVRGYHEDTGEMNQEAFFAVTDFITKKVSPLQVIRNMLRAVDAMADKGIGMMHTVSGVGFPLDLDVTMETILGKGLDTGFQTRVFFQTMDVGKVKKRKLPRVGGCFATALDGCFGSEDAALNKPYANNPQNRGILFHRDEEVIEFAKTGQPRGVADRDACDRRCGLRPGAQGHRGGPEGLPPGGSPPRDHPRLPPLRRRTAEVRRARHPDPPATRLSEVEPGAARVSGKYPRGSGGGDLPVTE